MRSRSTSRAPTPRSRYRGAEDRLPGADARRLVRSALGDRRAGSVEFWTSMRNIVAVRPDGGAAAVLPALVLSSILSSRMRGMSVFRAIYFIPSVAGVIGVAIIWGRLLEQHRRLDQLSDQAVRRHHAVHRRRRPRVTPGSATARQRWCRWSVVFAWMSFGFNTVLYLAGHQSIPKELYEAAEIDGATHVAGVPQDHRATAAQHHVLRARDDVDPRAAAVRHRVDPVRDPSRVGRTTRPRRRCSRCTRRRSRTTSRATRRRWPGCSSSSSSGSPFLQFRQQRDSATSGGLS